MGKTAGNAVWLTLGPRPARSSSTSTGAMSAMLMYPRIRMLTFLPLEQIDEMDHWEGEQLNKAKSWLLRADQHGARCRGS